MKPLCMDAYYFGFTPTGNRSIDVILSAVACAGKAYHHTESWNDECEPYHVMHRGSAPAEWVQCAGDDAAKIFEANEAKIAAAVKALEGAEIAVAELCQDQNPANECWNILSEIRATLASSREVQS